jgi:flagellar motility protein MotE (MotC chaperone)
MKTSDAVKVLAFMSDDEVQGVLEQLGVRQAAGLLAALPKERAAVLSRRLLHVDQRQASR